MNTNYEGDIEAIMEMVLDDNAERAIGALWMLKERMRRDRIESRTPSTVEIAEAARKVLPPIIPLHARFTPTEWPKFDPGKGRMRMDSPSLIPCPTCSAPKGHQCVKVTGDNLGAPLMGKKRKNAPPSPNWHDERSALAKKKRGAS